MSRHLARAALLTFAVGASIGQAALPPARAQNAPEPLRTTAFTAPPLIRATGDATPVALRAATVQVQAQGSLARTTVLLTLHNPNDRPLEGSLEFPLQPGQQVSAFALDVDGALRDAVPVPKEKAQQVFESIERRQVDPGLLEQTAGNHFRLRVYPIPARGIRQVRLVIDEAMQRDGDGWRLDVPVHLLAGSETFSLQVRAAGASAAPRVLGAFEGLAFRRQDGGYAATVERRAFRPAHGLALHFPGDRRAATFRQTVGDEHYVLAEIPLPADPKATAARALPDTVGLLWDASGSARTRDRQAEFALLDRYFQAMGQGEVRLRLLRDVGEDGGRFEIRGGDWRALRKALDAAVHDGASDLADWTPDAAVGEYLLVSDGLHNYGDHAFPTLRAGQALYAIDSAGAQGDAARLSALAEARGGRLVQVGTGAGVASAAAALLDNGTRIVSLEGEGIDALLPQAWSARDGVLRVAGRLTAPTATIRVRLRDGDAARTIEVPVAADAPRSDQVAALWANWEVAARAAEPERNRAQIARLGQRFGIVTPGTSLLVLEAPEDYVRHDIPAPPALRDRVAELRRVQSTEQAQSRSERLDAVAARFADRLAWWQRDFPKGAPPKPRDSKDRRAASMRGEAAAAADAALMPSMSAPPPAPPPAPMMAAEERAEAQASESRQRDIGDADDLRRSESEAPGGAAAKRAPGDTGEGRGVSIRLQAWAPDSPYARRLRAARAEDLYAVYLDERDSHADSTAFYLDVADLLLQKGRRAEALRVLSNLAELKLENRHVLRVLGYRLMQARDHARAVEVFGDVLRLADEEPQSHRDLGLALAASGQRQAGIERLYEVVARTWDARFSDIELVALNELNAILATSPAPLDTAFIDRRLLRNMPLDLRVVLAWDSDNSDMDLWVTDPNGERCYYGHKNTYQGGLISDDFTGGYGPEEFVLRDARPGKYKVEANFFGDRQQIVTGATTLSLMFSTGWGTRRQADQAVTLRLSGQSETVFVGEFEVK